MTEPGPEPSERMLRFIETYNSDGHVFMREINHDIWRPWGAGLPEEFENAVRAGVFNVRNWGVCYNGGLDDIDAAYVDEDVRLFWKAIFPGRPFPVGNPELPPTEDFPDEYTRFWTAGGIGPSPVPEPSQGSETGGDSG